MKTIFSQDFKCYVNSHKFEVYNDKEKLKNLRGEEIGKIIINRCSNCGKIKIIRINNLETSESFNK